jgi:thiol:disulfide interchange protein
VLPSSMVNKIDAAADKGGYVGVFFMALTLVVVSFSCTVPFVGSLLILSAKGEIWRPLYGMLAFGLPFALVFSGLAFFPKFLQKLPKSGGWLGEMKVVFALIEFALALKFLSNIDLVYHFNLLYRNTFLIIWIVFFVLIALYIFGILRLPSDQKVKQFGFGRIAFGTLAAAFAVYLVMGLNAKPLQLLQGFLPPQDYGKTKQASSNGQLREMAHGLEGYADYDDALAAAKAEGKPILIDFTGYACANCRKMEENIWPNEEVNKRMKEDFVLASLYVDDKKALPKEKQYVSKDDDELKATVGEKNLDIEITKFNNNAQPLYCIIDADGKLLVPPFSYTAKPEDFIAFLDSWKKK